ncbi:MAG: mechanosensitive ion channel family protein [Desulfurococcales archaeon]|nr:mechanosensitive ion channel family protein [Desulfurococcales archaeon]
MDFTSLLVDLESSWLYIKSNRILLDLTYTALVLIILYLVIKGSHKTFRGLYKKGIMTENAAEKISRTIDLITYILAIIAIIYIFTQAQQLGILVIVLIILGIIISWDVLVNLVGYYTIMISRIIEVGSYIEIGEIEGRVREISLLHTVLETGGGIQCVPNKEFLQRTYRVHGETIDVCLKLKIYYEGGLSTLANLEKKLSTLLEARKGEYLAVPDEKIRLTPLKVTSEYGEYLMKTRMQGPRYDQHRIGQLIKTIANAMVTSEIKGEIETVKCQQPNP